MDRKHSDVIATGSSGGMRVYELWSDGSFTERQDTICCTPYGGAIVTGQRFETVDPPRGLRWYLRAALDTHDKARKILAAYEPAWVGVYEPKRGAA